MTFLPGTTKVVYCTNSAVPEVRLSQLSHCLHSSRVHRHSEEGDEVSGVSGGDNDAGQPPRRQPPVILQPYCLPQDAAVHLTGGEKKKLAYRCLFESRFREGS